MRVPTNTGPYGPDSTVDFTITVYNQGDTDATDVEVKDYVPAGLTLAPASAPDLDDLRGHRHPDYAVRLGGRGGHRACPSVSSSTPTSWEIPSSIVPRSVVSTTIITRTRRHRRTRTPPRTTMDRTTPKPPAPDEIDDDGPGTPGAVDDPGDEDDYDFRGHTGPTKLRPEPHQARGYYRHARPVHARQYRDVHHRST